MTKVALFKFLLLMLLTSAAYGQKVKYKDIWGLLSTKQYEAAEPFLKGYLRENNDNPNALLYMGIIYHEKSAKDDVLKQTKRALADMDSAIMFYDKAHKAINEKELKRNDEYYQAYNRRDLRTGEFGVKLSDVQYDLEKKMESLRERIDRVKMTKYYFNLADSLYRKCTALYKTIPNQYPGQKEFYLRADDTTLKLLAALAVRYDSCVKAFDNYKSSAATLGRTGYNQNLNARDIQDIKTDGATPANFFIDDIQAWDYTKFASKSKTVIEKEIMPMREHLVSYDMEINKLREKLNKDSVSVRSDLTKLIDKLLMEQLRKYDNEPLPMQVFALKIADLDYRSVLLEHKSARDSADVNVRLKVATQELDAAKKLDSLANILAAADLDKKAIDYDFFVKNTYNNVTVLKGFINAINEYAQRERKKREALVATTRAALLWIVDGADSIPASFDVTSKTFKPLLIEAQKYTAGIHYADSLNPVAYFYTIAPSRKAEVKATYALDKNTFKQPRFDGIKAITYAEATGQVYFILVFSEQPAKDNKYTVNLAKVYRSDGLAWNTSYQLAYLPKEISFRPENGEITLRGETQQSLIDKNGKFLK